MKRLLCGFLAFMVIISVCLFGTVLYASAANSISVSDLEFRELPDGTLELCHISDSSSDNIDLLIPSTYNGKTVTKIAAYTFAENDTIASVTIPESIVSIGDGAFEECANLKTINFNAKKCTYMGTYKNKHFIPFII